MGSRSATSLHVLQGDVQAQLSNLRDEGNKHFGKKDYAKALESYDKALKLIPATHQDKPLLHSNKAACHMMAKKYVNVLSLSGRCFTVLIFNCVLCLASCWQSCSCKLDL